MPEPAVRRLLKFLLPLLLLSPLIAETDHVEGEAIVIFKPGTADSKATTALGKRALHMDRRSRHRNRITGLVRDRKLSTSALIASLKNDPDVETAEPNYLRRICASVPNDTEFPKLWGLRNTGQVVNFTASSSGADCNFLPAWRMARPSSAEIVVGVMDTGIDPTHPDLVSNLWTNTAEIPGNLIDDDANGYTDDIHGYDFVLNTPALTDTSYHGTHLAGTIAAAGKNSTGIIGVQYQAKVLPLQVSFNGNTMSTAAILDAISYAVTLKQRGVNIVALNASFSGPSFSTAEFNAIESLRNAGIILCAAAGNETVNNDSTPSYPASYTNSNVISVAALTQTNTLAGYSNFGATSVDIGAPGTNIYSTIPYWQTTPLSSLTVGTTSHATAPIQYSGSTSPTGVTGNIIACGIGLPNQFPPSVSGNIALIQRGTLNFAEKVANAKAAGATAAIIYDNIAGGLGGAWTLNTPGAWLPAFKVTQATGQDILAQLPSAGTAIQYYNPANFYSFQSGTSMAAPHVAGAVAFAARNFPTESVSQRIARILNHGTSVPALAGKCTTGSRLDLLKIVDTDSDQLPDWWETEHFTNLSHNGSADSDSDGFSDLNEFMAATDPLDSNSHLAFSSAAADGTGSHFILTFPSVEDRLYQIEWSGDLENGSWQPLGLPFIGTGASLQIQDGNAISGFPKRFYRMTILPD